jgi:hypothetical protein
MIRLYAGHDLPRLRQIERIRHAIGARAATQHSAGRGCSLVR